MCLKKFKSVRLIVMSVVCTVMLICTTVVQSQPLFTIADKDTVFTDEFMRMAGKNNVSPLSDEVMKEYLELFINYKLKLKQADEEQLRSNKEIQQQVKDYVQEIIKPIVYPASVNDSLIKEAYNRLYVYVRAAHKLIPVPNNIPIKDTLQYYNQAQKLLHTDNLNFDTGDVGYFSSMTMIYPFEQACYSNIDLSNPTVLKDSLTFCRSSAGYHVIKIKSVVPVDFYSLNLAHIFISSANHSDEQAQQLINEAYNKIDQLGFDSVASLYSEDKYSASNRGLLLNQKPNTLPAEYLDYYIALKDSNNKMTQPFKTKFGWHIVRYLSSKPIPQYEELRDEIAARIAKDDRAYFAYNRFVEQTKEKYPFKVDSSSVTQLYNIVSDDAFNATWQLPDKTARYDKKLFYVGDTSFSQYDFMSFLFETQYKSTPMHISSYIDSRLNVFMDNKVSEYGIRQTVENNNEIKQNIHDFEDGLLIFELTNRYVWNRSLSDSLGLEDFYEQNKSKYLYTQRADAVIWYVDTTIDLKKLTKQITKLRKKGKTYDEISDVLSGKNIKNRYVWNRFEQGSNNIIDKNIFANLEKLSSGKMPYYCSDTLSVTNRNLIICLNEILPVSIKPLSVCSGLVRSDYQEYLEEEWIKTLKEKYPIRIIHSKF